MALHIASTALYTDHHPSNLPQNKTKWEEKKQEHKLNAPAWSLRKLTTLLHPNFPNPHRGKGSFTHPSNFIIKKQKHEQLLNKHKHFPFMPQRSQWPNKVIIIQHEIPTTTNPFDWPFSGREVPLLPGPPRLQHPRCAIQQQTKPHNRKTKPTKLNCLHVDSQSDPKYQICMKGVCKIQHGEYILFNYNFENQNHWSHCVLKHNHFPLWPQLRTKQKPLTFLNWSHASNWWCNNKRY